MNYQTATVKELHNALISGDITAKSLLDSARKTIKEKDEDVQAFLEVFTDSADEDAKRADEMIAAGKATILTGIPIAIKDNICSEGNSVTCASKILNGFVSPFNSTVVRKLKEQGAVIVGRTNMDEFAMGSSCETSAYKQTKNPNDLEKVPGGSSGGSAACVAAGMVPLALGSDTGGSIRQPASFCGIVGLKPTYGSVSRYGLIALGSSLDVIGPFARNVEDAKILFDAIKDSTCDYDSTCGIYSKNKEEKSSPKTIGVPDLSSLNISEDMMNAFNNTIDELRNKGHNIVDISLPLMNKAGSLYYIIQPAEVSSNLARFDGMRYGVRVEGDNLWGDYIASRSSGFGDEVIRRIVVGTYVLSAGYYDAYYKKAIAARQALQQSIMEAFKTVDVIMTPTTPDIAFSLNSKKDPLSMYAEDRLTLQANLTGLPAISIPMKVSGLPLGIQILGQYNSEEKLIEYGREIEEIS